MDGWMDKWMDGWINGWMDGWMDEWMDGWMDGWIYGWMDGWSKMTDCADKCRRSLFTERSPLSPFRQGVVDGGRVRADEEHLFPVLEPTV